MSSSDKGFRQGAIVPREALKSVQKSTIFLCIIHFVFQHMSQKRFESRSCHGLQFASVNPMRLFLLRESPQNFPRGETNRKRVAALRTEGKHSTKQSVKRAPRALFPRPDWMKGVQPSWASFLSPSISQQLDQPIFQQEFDV